MKVKIEIKKIFNLLGYEIKKKDREIEELSFDEILKKKLKKKSPTIIDVGANNGQSINRFLKLFKNSKIHSFEPIKEEFEKLKNNFGKEKNIFLNNYAVGENKKTKYFNISAKTENSSFNNFNYKTKWIKKRSQQYGVSKKKYVIKRQKVNLDTLDNYCKKNNIHHIDILKIDTQGYEDKVLIGCKKLIEQKKIGVVITEIMFDNVYEKYFSFSDIEKFLVNKDFRMVGINLTNNNLFSGILFMADVMYFNKKYFRI